MRLLKIFGREARTAWTQNDAYLARFLESRSASSAHPSAGPVDPLRAAGLAVAQACISTIAQSLASVPLNVYRRTENGGRERATDHPLFDVLRDAPNPLQTAFEMREFLIASLLIYGNAFARIVRDRNGQVVGLVPLDPGVAVERLAGGRLRYRAADLGESATAILLQDEVLHLRYRLGRDGIMGLSPIQIARETFGLALAQSDTANGFNANAVRPSGIIKHPGSFKDKESESDFLNTLRATAAGQNSGRLLLLKYGAEFQQFQFSSEDAEFLESRKLTNLDICRVYGVPPTTVGIVDHATYSNVDQEGRALVARCLAPMAIRTEQSFNAALLSMSERQTLFIEHDLAGLLRGDQKARYEAYQIGRQWGWLSQNEIRAFENMPEVEGGDEYLSPLNMVPLGERKPASDIGGDNA